MSEGQGDEMLSEVLAGLRMPEKRIPSKYHYDARGSALFEQITGLEEYYPTRTERELLERWMPEWVEEFEPKALVELGAGGADKSRIILDAMVKHCPDPLYVPVDVSGDFLHETAEQLRNEYGELRVEPEVADMSRPFELTHTLPEPSWIAFLGSTLGNFEPEGAVRLLGRIRDKLGDQDRFVLGVDLRPGPHKSRERIELAYNDSAGVTEQFSLNLLQVLNRELDADFDLEGFEYRSVYNEELGRIETFQVARAAQTVRFPGGEEVGLAEGEPIRTEISAKYDRETVEGFFVRAGLRVDRWVEDSCAFYALVMAAVI